MLSLYNNIPDGRNNKYTESDFSQEMGQVNGYKKIATSNDGMIEIGGSYTPEGSVRQGSVKNQGKGKV